MSNKFIIDQEAVRHLAQVLVETDLTEIEYAVEDRRIRVVRSITAAPTMMAHSIHHPAEHGVLVAPHTDKTVRHPGAVESPMVGTAYLSSEPGTAAFVKVGDQINQGDTLLIVESMKVMNPIRASRSGTIRQILVQDASPVEFGEVLMIIE